MASFRDFTGESCQFNWKIKRRELDSVKIFYTKNAGRHQGSYQQHKFHRSARVRAIAGKPYRDSGVSRGIESLQVLLPALLLGVSGCCSPTGSLDTENHSLFQPALVSSPYCCGENPSLQTLSTSIWAKPTINKVDFLFPMSSHQMVQMSLLPLVCFIKFSQLEFFFLLTKVTPFEKASTP